MPELWKGFTRSDIGKLDTIFDLTVVNEKRGYKISDKFSMCPVCLVYIEHSDDCMFMKHNCSEGEFYHKKLYDLYKSDDGKIHWCTICNRICIGHRHYELTLHNIKSKLTENKGSGAFGENDCLKGGGGGNDEKFIRFSSFRKYALKLQDDIDKKDKDTALTELVEYMWDSPMKTTMFGTLKRTLNKFIGRKSWNIPTNKFKANNISSKKKLVSKNVPYNGKLPELIKKGRNNITAEEDIPIIKFYHTQLDKTEKTHSISDETLKEFVVGQNKNFGDIKKFGFCFMNPDCNSKLDPAEIKPYIEKDIYEEYKNKFNDKFNSILHEATDAMCAKKANNSRNRRNGNGTGNGQRKTKKARHG
jgi:hypothetical protein